MLYYIMCNSSHTWKSLHCDMQKIIIYQSQVLIDSVSIVGTDKSEW